MAYKRVLKNEEMSRLKKMIGTYEDNFTVKKIFKRFINTIYRNFKLRFKKGELSSVLERMRKEFKDYFNINLDGDIKVQRYGLSGAGIYFLNSTIKL